MSNGFSRLNRTDNGEHRTFEGSVTVEASIVFPVFFFFVWMIWQIFLVILLTLNLTLSVAKTAGMLSAAGYPVRDACGEKCEDTKYVWLPALYAGVLSGREEFYGDLWIDFEEEEESVYIIEVTAKLPIAAPFFGRFTLPVEQRFKLHANTGVWDPNAFSKKEEAKEGETESEKVYVTESGSVYHRSLTCSHLSVKAEAVSAEDVGNRRNRDGKKYELCSYCKNSPRGDEVFITAYGTKYHFNADCLALKRKVREVSLDEVKGMKPCSTCGNVDPQYGK